MSMVGDIIELLIRLFGRRKKPTTEPPSETLPPEESPEFPSEDDALPLDEFLESDEGYESDPYEDVPPPAIPAPVNLEPLPEPPAPVEPVLEEEEDPSDCTFPVNQDLPSNVSHEDVPHITTDAQAATFGAQAVLDSNFTPTFSAQSSDCVVTIRPELGTVNLRLGPSLAFEPPIAKTKGGVRYELAGASETEGDAYRWFAVKLGATSAWVRSDLVNLSVGCADFTFITEDDVEQNKPPVNTGKFLLPVSAPISQGYKSSHRGFDLSASEGSALIAPIDGVCIRRVDCTKCTPARPNRYPNASFQCPDTWRDPAWGFGYGNFIIVRHDYHLLPMAMRSEMDKRDLKGGFAYILYAHLSKVNVALGQSFGKGTVIGNTGNTGCSTAPHLHFEVRIGSDELVDNVWSLQRAVYPGLMFDV